MSFAVGLSQRWVHFHPRGERLAESSFYYFRVVMAYSFLPFKISYHSAQRAHAQVLYYCFTKFGCVNSSTANTCPAFSAGFLLAGVIHQIFQNWRISLIFAASELIALSNRFSPLCRAG